MTAVNGALHLAALLGIVWLAERAWNAWQQPILATAIVITGLWFIGAALWDVWYGGRDY